MPPLILASTSPYRRALLERLGVPFLALTPACDEEALKTPGMPPERMALTLARAKAASVADTHHGAVVIGSDQVCALDDEILHKPGTQAKAIAQLERLSGRAHRLITAVSLRHGVWEETHVETVTLRMRALDHAALVRYAVADDPVDCAGAYKLERRGIALFERIEAADHDSIVGLPLLWLVGRLAKLGYPIP